VLASRMRARAVADSVTIPTWVPVIETAGPQGRGAIAESGNRDLLAGGQQHVEAPAGWIGIGLASQAVRSSWCGHRRDAISSRNLLAGWAAMRPAQAWIRSIAASGRSPPNF